jgi:hypothetical protein
MSEWYGAMFISYASAVRRLVYANQQAGNSIIIIGKRHS